MLAILQDLFKLSEINKNDNCIIIHSKRSNIHVGRENELFMSKLVTVSLPTSFNIILRR